MNSKQFWHRTCSLLPARIQSKRNKIASSFVLCCSSILQSTSSSMIKIIPPAMFFKSPAQCMLGVHLNIRFSDFAFFFFSEKSPYDLRSQIRFKFRILPKKPPSILKCLIIHSFIFSYVHLLSTILPSFCIYPNLSSSNFIRIHLPTFTIIYFHPYSFTLIYHHLPSFA